MSPLFYKLRRRWETATIAYLAVCHASDATRSRLLSWLLIQVSRPLWWCCCLLLDAVWAEGDRCFDRLAKGAN